MRGRAIALGLSLSACSTLGTPPSEPAGLPHGGTGPFRLLTTEETGLPAMPPGVVLAERSRAVESGMIAGDFLFYAGAGPRTGAPDAGPPDAGAQDAGPPDAGAQDAGAQDAGAQDAGAQDAGPPAASGVDWSLYPPRAILRASAGAGHSFESGVEVLSAQAPWEGSFVHDPWVVVLPDGRARLYYAAERGGIGVAEAASAGGVFARVGAAPIVPDARRPSVVPGPGGTPAFLMYAELGDTLRVFGSDDGLSFGVLVEALVLPPMPARDDRDSTEVGLGAPGALLAHTPAGRSVVRLYYESRRADGSVLLGLAGSFDGLSFEALGIPVADSRAHRFPAPLQLDDRLTLLVMAGSSSGTSERGAVVAGLAPGGATLP